MSWSWDGSWNSVGIKSFRHLLRNENWREDLVKYSCQGLVVMFSAIISCHLVSSCCWGHHLKQWLIKKNHLWSMLLERSLFMFHAIGFPHGWNILLIETCQRVSFSPLSYWTGPLAVHSAHGVLVIEQQQTQTFRHTCH